MKKNDPNYCTVSDWNGDCCCNCENHYEDFHHCNSKNKTPEEVENNTCVCSQHKGWICLVIDYDTGKYRAHSDWSEHGYCDMHVRRKVKSNINVINNGNVKNIINIQENHGDINL